MAAGLFRSSLISLGIFKYLAVQGCPLLTFIHENYKVSVLLMRLFFPCRRPSC